MKLAIINVSLRPDAARRMLPVGLAYILTALKHAGIPFDFIDMDIDNMSENELKAIFDREKYDAVGLGCIVTGLRQVRDIARLAKDANLDCMVFAGNSVATSIPELLLQNTHVDIAILHEGDNTVVELAFALMEGKELDAIPGLAFLKGNEVVYTPRRKLISHLDSIGYPDWSIFDIDRYLQFSKINVNHFRNEEIISFPLSTARGCPHSCTFCYHVFKGLRYRRYSDDRIIKEIIHLKETFDADYMSFWDELSFPNIASIERFLDALETLDFEIGWDAPCRAGLFKKEHLPLIQRMKASGCDNISFSLENADPTILEAMNKNITVEEFTEQAHILQRGGIIPLTSVIFGYPQETPETIKKTIKVCAQCNIYPSVGFLLPLPGTPIYRWALENGKILDELEYLLRIGDRQDFHVNLTGMPDDEFVGLVTEELVALAKSQGLDIPSPFKTTTYVSPITQA